MVKIFIDAGHGGTDSGAVGNGLKEKDLTLQIAKKIESLLKKYENVQVKMSRTGDTYPSLTERVKMANDWKADFFLSIHINGGGGTGYEDFIFTGSTKSADYQNIIHEEIVKKIDMNNRGKKQGNFQVLRTTNMPALLTENGFIDSKSDTDKLKQSSFINALSEGHVNGLVKSFKLKEKQPISNNKGEIRMFKSTSNTLNDNFIKMLEDAYKAGIIKSENWITKAKKGTLTLDDAIALVAVIHNRAK